MLLSKGFYDISLDEIFLIYKARCDIFVVEQNCPYPEVDDFDKAARHIALLDGDTLLSYCRLLPKGCRFDEVSIGRVLATKRRCGYASEVVREAIRVAFCEWNAEKIILDAQTYAIPFYEKLGFKVTSDEFLEDGIPHVQMTQRRRGYGESTDI